MSIEFGSCWLKTSPHAESLHAAARHYLLSSIEHKAVGG